jgi:hypothetical protein
MPIQSVSTDFHRYQFQRPGGVRRSDSFFDTDSTAV